MYIEENWALFVENTNQVKWTFGNPDTEFLQVVIGFLSGLSSIGEELFNEGVADIKFNLPKRSGFKASEIFIVSLQNTFFLIMSDPTVTLKLIKARGGVPKEIEDIIRAVLVGQASIIYATTVTELADSDEQGLSEVDKKFRDIILDINEDYAADIDHIIGEGRTNFSCLDFSDLIFLHYYLRKERALRLGELNETRNIWCLISDISGVSIPLSYNIKDKNPLVLSGYLGIIIQFIQALFNSKPKSLTFGTIQISDLKFIHAPPDENDTEYFMAVSGELKELFRSKSFLKKFNSLKKDVVEALEEELKECIIDEILENDVLKLKSLRVSRLINKLVSMKTKRKGKKKYFFF